MRQYFATIYLEDIKTSTFLNCWYDCKSEKNQAIYSPTLLCIVNDLGSLGYFITLLSLHLHLLSYLNFIITKNSRYVRFSKTNFQNYMCRFIQNIFHLKFSKENTSIFKRQKIDLVIYYRKKKLIKFQTSNIISDNSAN